MNKIDRKLKKVILTKISDDTFNGNHPNGIYTGMVIKGLELNPPTVGERYVVHCQDGFSTSIVTRKPNKDGIFKTMYSTYKLEYVKLKKINKAIKIK